MADPRKVPASGEAVNDVGTKQDRAKMPAVLEAAAGLLPDFCADWYETRQNVAYPRISKAACRHYDSGHCNRIVRMLTS